MGLFARRACVISRVIVWMIGWLIGGICLPFNGFADSPVEDLMTLSMEHLMALPVRSVGFFDVPASMTPGGIWILDTEDLETFPANGLGELLSLSVPGVQVSGHRLTGGLFSSRGGAQLDNSTSQFMWEGVNLNSAGSQGVNSALKLPLFGDLDRVEIGYGPSGIIHGNGALNGFVNLVPKNGADYPGGFIRVGFGGPEAMRQVETGYGYAYGPGRDIFIYGGLVRADGFTVDDDMGFDADLAKNGLLSPETAFPDPVTADSMPEANYRTSFNWHHGMFQLTGLVQKEYVSSNGIAASSDDSSMLYYRTVALSPSFEYPVSPMETVELAMPVSLFDAAYIYTLRKEYSNSGAVEEKERGESDVRGELRCVLKTTRFERQQFAAGFGVGQERYRANRYFFRADPDPSLIGDDVDWWEYSLFAEDRISLSPEWTVTAGCRMDAIRYSLTDAAAYLSEFIQNGHLWSPRLAVLFQPTGTTLLNLCYQEGFHYPPATALYGRMVPESMNGLEGSLQHEVPALGLEGRVNLYWNTYKDSILSNSYENLRDDFHVIGGEASLTWRGFGNTEVQVSYAYCRPTDDGEGADHLITASEDRAVWYAYPLHMVKGYIRHYFLDRRAMVMLAGEYGRGLVETSNYDYVQDARKMFTRDRYRVNARARYDLSSHWRIDLTVRNLMDNDVPSPMFDYLYPWEGELGYGTCSVYAGIEWH